MQAWSVAPSAAGDKSAEYRGRPRPGAHHHRPSAAASLDVRRLLVRRPRDVAVKQVRLRLINRGHRTIQPPRRRHRRVDLGAQPVPNAALTPDQRRQPARRAGRERRLGRRVAQRRAADHHSLLHPARPRRRLRRRHRLLRPCWRCRRPDRLDLRPARVVRCPRPPRHSRPVRPGERRRPRSVRGDRHPHHAACRRHHRAHLPARLGAEPRRRTGAGCERRPGAVAEAKAGGTRPLGRAARKPRW